MKKNNFRETLWKSAEKLRGQMDAAEYKHIVLGLIFLKYISDSFSEQKENIRKMVTDKNSDYFLSESIDDINDKDLEDRDYYTKDNVFWVPKSARWEILRSQAKQSDFGFIIDNALRDIESENISLKGKLDKRYGKTELAADKLGELFDLVSKIGFGENLKASDILGEVYEYFLGMFASAEGKRGGQYYTTKSIVKTLVAVLSPNKGRVYDPCCGSGGMFVQSEQFVEAHGGKRDDISIYGQESNPTTWRLAAMNMALRGYSADLGKEHGSTFAKDQHPDIKFDYILANPPFNDSDWDGEKFREDVRWIYGTPSVGNANFAWFQHILSKLKQDGQAGVVMSNGASTSDTSGDGDIRRAMVLDDVVEVMISLPSQLFANVQVPATLWFLSKDKTKNGRNRKNETLFINSKKLGVMTDSTHKIFTEEDIDKISKTVNNWRLGKDYEDEKSFCKSVTTKEIEEKSFFLSPARYIEIEDSDKEDNFFSERLTTLKNTFLELDRESNNLSNKLLSMIKKINHD